MKMMMCLYDKASLLVHNFLIHNFNLIMQIMNNCYCNEHI